MKHQKFMLRDFLTVVYNWYTFEIYGGYIKKFVHLIFLRQLSEIKDDFQVFSEFPCLLEHPEC